MILDPIVEEVRKYREDYFMKFNYDLNAMFNDLERLQEVCDHNLVSLPPKRIERAIVSSQGDADG